MSINLCKASLLPLLPNQLPLFVFGNQTLELDIGITSNLALPQTKKEAKESGSGIYCEGYWLFQYPAQASDCQTQTGEAGLEEVAEGKLCRGLYS